MAEAQAGTAAAAGTASETHTAAASILFVGDVVGGIGKQTLFDCLPILRERHNPTFVVVNGENAAGGLGITPKIADQMFAAGVDAITLGNHTYHRREIYPYLDDSRPDRAPRQLPAQPARTRRLRGRARRRVARRDQPQRQPVRARRALRVHRDRGRARRSSARWTTCSWTCTRRPPPRRSRSDWHLDGRVSAVVGTHTHVPTADARVLPGGTAYITDVGMTGPRGGVIGVKREQAIESLLTQMPIAL